MMPEEIEPIHQSSENTPAPRECWDKCGNCGGYDVTVYAGNGAQCQDCGSTGPFIFSAGMARHKTNAVV